MQARLALLRRAIAGLNPKQLGRRAWRSTWSVAENVYGIASHDLYHAGQIQLIKRLVEQHRDLREVV